MFASQVELKTTPRALEWDSAHFGDRVGEIPCPDLTDEQLFEVLIAAQANRYRLLYWSTSSGRYLPSLFDQFGATPVNQRVVFVAALSGPDRPFHRGDAPADAALDNDVCLEVVPRQPATDGLRDLAVMAGAHSRFCVDPRIPQERFQSLYCKWIDRSTKGEMADQVLVAKSTAGRETGMITMSVSGCVGQIGLIAVHPNYRGQGIASRLMSAAHKWFHAHDATRVKVVTQLENRTACRLYESWDYVPAEIRQWFHFWLGESADTVDPSGDEWNRLEESRGV